MQKKGDFNLSFSMIFSIIVIIAILAVAFYVIYSFISTGKCAEIGIFYDGLEDYIDKAWEATIQRDLFSGSLPDGIEYVCFGSLTQSSIGESRRIQSEIYKFFINEKDNNIFLYPTLKACDSYLSSFKLNHVQTDSFFCVPVKNGMIQIKTEKTQYDAFVSISLP